MGSWFGRYGNLLQNPGFESGLAFWVSDNVVAVDTAPAEGTQAARMGPGVASMIQDTHLGLCRDPLFLSFIVYTEESAVSPGDLVAEVIWLDAERNAVGSGLRAFLSGAVISTKRITYFDVTDNPPPGAAWARLQLSKGGAEDTSLVLDQLLLTPVGTKNLVRNPGFERGLQGWRSTSFFTGFLVPWEGSANAEAFETSAELYQDVDIGALHPRASYLLSFAVEAPGGATLGVQLIWLNAAGEPVGAPGIDLFVPGIALAIQNNYLSYLMISDPAPFGAVRARIRFTASSLVPSPLRIDQVMLLRTTSDNTVLNPGFVDGLDNWFVISTEEAIGEAYVGSHFARIPNDGGVLYQAVRLPISAAGNTFLFSFALNYTGTPLPSGNLIAEVRWLDCRGNDIGLGISVVVPLLVFAESMWLVYTSVTDRAPAGTAAAKVQFTKSAGGVREEGAIGIDHVLLAIKR